MARTAKNYLTKKRELVGIAENLFLKKGYEETSVDDILSASGISKGGFYHYFKTKDEVLAESVAFFIEDTLTELEPIVENRRINAVEKLMLFLTKQAALKQSKIRFAKYFGMVISSDLILFKFYLSMCEKYVPSVTKIIEQGVQEGVFNVEFPLETADILVRMLATAPQSNFYSGFMNGETDFSNYADSMQAIISRTLGMQTG